MAPRRAKALSIAIALVLLLPLSACSTAQSSRICEAAGGSYANGTCQRPGQPAAQEECENRGGVYLTGQDYCALGEGGP